MAIQVVLENTRLLHLSVCSVFRQSRGIFSQLQLFQRAFIPIGCSTLCLLATGDAGTSWLAVETSDVRYVLKMAPADNSVSPPAGSSRAEADQLQLPLQLFRLVVNLWHRLDLKERASTHEMNCEPEQKQGGEGAAELLPKESHAATSLISKCCLPKL